MLRVTRSVFPSNYLHPLIRLRKDSAEERVRTRATLPPRSALSSTEEALEWRPLGEDVKNTHQSVKLGDADFIGVHHAELLPGHQVQAELPETHTHTRTHRLSARHTTRTRPRRLKQT